MSWNIEPIVGYYGSIIPDIWWIIINNLRVGRCFQFNDKWYATDGEKGGLCPIVDFGITVFELEIKLNKLKRGTMKNISTERQKEIDRHRKIDNRISRLAKSLPKVQTQTEVSSGSTARSESSNQKYPRLP